MAIRSALRAAGRVLPRFAAVALGGGVAFGAATFCAASAVPAPSAKPAAHAAVKDVAYYQKVYNAVAARMNDVDWDDGSWGPVLIRLAWHAAGTYDKATGTGGSNGATMRFPAEAGHGANAGLSYARSRLEMVKKEFPEISYSDLWSLAGVVAVQEMGGPTVVWRPGRVDAVAATACTPDGRLPDATKKAPHLRDVFYRMGFNDQDIVVLSGAHALGRCHHDRSGFVGPWTFSPTTFSNDFYAKLLSEKWVPKKWAGPLQFEDAATGTLMMLPSDLALVEDPAMLPWVKVYAADRARFFDDFAVTFRKLEELGVPFPAGSQPIELKRTE